MEGSIGGVSPRAGVRRGASADAGRGRGARLHPGQTTGVAQALHVALHRGPEGLARRAQRRGDGAAFQVRDTPQPVLRDMERLRDARRLSGVKARTAPATSLRDHSATNPGARRGACELPSTRDTPSEFPLKQALSPRRAGGSPRVQASLSLQTHQKVRVPKALAAKTRVSDCREVMCMCQ